MKIIIYDLLDVLETFDEVKVAKFLKKHTLDDILVGYDRDSTDEYCLMLQAIKHKSPTFVKYLLDNNYRVNEEDDFERNTTHYLELYGTEEIKKLLEGYNFNVSYLYFPKDELEVARKQKKVAKTIQDLYDAHDYTSENAYSLFIKQECVCIYCKERFNSSEIIDHTFSSGGVSLCPYCGIDSVIGEISGYDLSDLFIEVMYEFFFNNSDNISNHLKHKMSRYGRRLI
jgi:hypothetical protein